MELRDRALRIQYFVACCVLVAQGAKDVGSLGSGRNLELSCQDFVTGCGQPKGHHVMIQLGRGLVPSRPLEQNQTEFGTPVNLSVYLSEQHALWRAKMRPANESVSVFVDKDELWNSQKNQPSLQTRSLAFANGTDAIAVSTRDAEVTEESSNASLHAQPGQDRDDSKPQQSESKSEAGEAAASWHRKKRNMFAFGFSVIMPIVGLLMCSSAFGPEEPGNARKTAYDEDSDDYWGAQKSVGVA